MTSRRCQRAATPPLATTRLVTTLGEHSQLDHSEAPQICHLLCHPERSRGVTKWRHCAVEGSLLQVQSQASGTPRRWSRGPSTAETPSLREDIPSLRMTELAGAR